MSFSTSNTQSNLATHQTTGALHGFNMDTINDQAFISRLTATLHSNGQPEMDSLVIATAFYGNMDKLGLVSGERWIKNVNKYIHKTGDNGTRVVVGDKEHTGFDIPNWFDTIVHAELMTRDGQIGSKLVDMVLITERSLPASAEHGVERRNPIVPYHNKYKLASTISALLKQAIYVLENTPFMVDEYMYSLSLAVNELHKLDDKYVIEGCAELLKYGNTPRVSEFKTDRRIRIYQADTFGPNGQSSDMARSFMDLAGVHTNYDIKRAIMAIRDEMEDMLANSSLQDAIDNLRATKSLAVWMQGQLVLKEHDKANTLPESEESDYIVSKPWSFVKANRLLTSLEKGGRPYIGMAFGLDAKCSGPQYGAIMTGDIRIAAACGFGNMDAIFNDDAYEIAVKACQDAGIEGLTRKTVKKAYMGIFYGQGAGSFADEAMYGSKPKMHDPRLLPIIQGIEAIPGQFESMLMAQAKVFHKAIESSFGNMTDLRKAMKLAHYHYEDMEGVPVKVMDTTEPTMHRMPDDTFIAMDYRVKTTITGEVVSFDTEIPDVSIDISGIPTMKFEKMTFRQKEYNLDDYARSGFVNMIQGVDAYIARHIIVALGELGATHVISVHDCFRVNINDFLDGKLHQAIQMAYKRVFVECGTKGDIIKDYFQGVRNAGGTFPRSSIAFMLDDGELKMADWLDVDVIIDNLANKIDGKEGTYYFAK